MRRLALLTVALAVAPLVTVGAQEGWVVTYSSFGPVRFGMTTTQAGRALGLAVTFAPEMAPDDPCGHARWEGKPQSLRVRVMHDTIVGVVVERPSTVRTADGIGLGSTEQQLRELYADRLTVDPRMHDDDGHFFTVAPVAPADSAYRLIFETDGRGTVVGYRAGLLSAVEYAEWCM